MTSQSTTPAQTDPGQDLVATVLGGIHSGAVFRLPPDQEWLVGSGDGAQVILDDADIDAACVTVGHRAGVLHLRAHAPNVRLDGGEMLEPGRAVHLSPPTRVQVSDTVALLFDHAVVRRSADGARLPPGRRARRLVPGLVLALIVVGTGLVAAHSLDTSGAVVADARPTATTALEPCLPGGSGPTRHGCLAPARTAAPAAERVAALDAAGRIDAPAAPVGIADPAAVAEVLAALRARMAAAGIDLTELQFAAEADSLRLSGAADAAGRAAWGQVRHWYDATWAMALPLRADIDWRAAPQLPQVALKAVWFGPHPYIMVADGTRHAEGDVIAGGWTVTRIAAGGVSLRRGARVIEIKP